MAKPLSHIENLLLDMDGTLYLGQRVFPYTLRFLAELRRRGRRYLFVTNNSSRAPSDYVKKLLGMGIEAPAADIYTSGDATIAYIERRRLPKRVFLVGTRALDRQFRRAGFTLTDEAPEMVVLGFDQTLTYAKLDKACRFVRAGLPYLATHPDRVCPIEGGESVPDCGAIAAAIHAATGRRPLALGKPSRHMARGVLERLKGERAVSLATIRHTTAMVGDRLYTDVRFGVTNGMKSVLVLSGEATRRDLRASRWKPDVIVPTVKDLLKLL